MKHLKRLLLLFLLLFFATGAHVSGRTMGGPSSPIDRPAYLHINITQTAEGSDVSNVFSHESFKPFFDARNQAFRLAFVEGLKQSAFEKTPRLLDNSLISEQRADTADPDTFRMNIDLRLTYGLKETSPFTGCLSALGCLFFTPLDSFEYEGFGIAHIVTTYTTPEGETIVIGSETFRHSETIRCDYIDILNSAKEIERIGLLNERVLSGLSTEILKNLPSSIIDTAQNKVGHFLSLPPIPRKDIPLCRLLPEGEYAEKPAIRKEVVSSVDENIEDAVRQAAPSIFAVETERGTGSGFVISRKGYGVTSLESVKDAKRLSVRFQNEESFSARTVHVSSELGLAILSLNGRETPPLPLERSRSDDKPETYILLGYLEGTGLVIVQGANAWLQKTPHPLESSVERFVERISGGPILNLRGEVAGIQLHPRNNNTEENRLPIEKARDFLEKFILSITSPET